MRRAFLIALLLACAPAAWAQNTVTATVVDPNGNPYANGTASAIRVVATGLSPGTPLNVTTSSLGFFTMSLPTATYVFTVCATPTQLGPTANPTPRLVCFSNPTPIAISGNLDVTTQLNAVATALGPALSANFTTSGGNNAFTGNNTFAGTSIFNNTATGNVAGTFTNTQMNDPFSFLTNSCVPQTLVNFVGQHNTDGLDACVTVPGGSTVLQANALAAYVGTSSASTNAVGIYALTIATSDNVTSHWGANFVSGDDGSRTANQQPIGLEVDIDQASPVSAYTAVYGYTAAIAGSGPLGTVPGGAAFLAGNNGVVGRRWDLGFTTVDNTVSTAAFNAGATCTSGSCSSQPLRFKSVNGGVGVFTSMGSDSLGNILITPPTGQGLRSPVFFCPEATAPSNYGAGFDQMWCDSGSHRWRMFNNGGVTLQVAGMLTGTTGTISGTALAATCDSGTVSITGAAVGSPVTVSTTDGTDIGGAFNIRGSVTSSGTVTVFVCGTGTPASKAYNVAVIQ
jgi:hypothetical protein